VRGDDAVIVVDDTMRLRRRPVEVLRLDADRAFLGEGLARGERVVISPLATFVEGMTVRIREEQPGAQAVAPAGPAEEPS